jgi:hypothetical protein
MKRSMKMSRPRRSTVPKAHPPKVRIPKPTLPKPAGRPVQPRPPARRQVLPLSAPKPPRSQVARIIDDSERSLVDVIDNLLNQGVMLNADIILALANVDLVYLRLSALLCAADRVLPDGRR